MSYNLSIQIELNQLLAQLPVDYQILKIKQVNKKYNLKEFKNKVKEIEQIL